MNEANSSCSDAGISETLLITSARSCVMMAEYQRATSDESPVKERRENDDGRPEAEYRGPDQDVPDTPPSVDKIAMPDRGSDAAQSRSVEWNLPLCSGLKNGDDRPRRIRPPSR